MNPKTDLLLERNAPVPPAVLWKAWTEPEHLKQWFTPKPWTTPTVEMQLRPGGKFRTVMRSPEGEEFDNIGCMLEVVPQQRLVWTTALVGDFRPITEAPPFHFTAVVPFAPEGDGTAYKVLLMHSDEEGAKKHEEMGFHDGWGTAYQQLLDYMKTVV